MAATKIGKEKMRLSAKDRLRRFLNLFSGEDHVLIPINADPDAIASAMAIKRLLWRKVAGVTISNINQIQRPDNLALIRLIGVALVPWEKVKPAAFPKVVMVDAQPDHHEIFKSLAPEIIIDHHPVNRSPEASFCDIRPQYGATASILVEYLRAAKIKPSAKLATALYCAIKTDTGNFERQTLIEDLNAFQFVFRYSNIAMARRIESVELPLESIHYFINALSTMQIRKGRAFVHLGPVDHPDIAVQIADFSMHIETVTWSIVSAVFEGRLVIIFRNDGIRKNAGRLAKHLFDKLGSAGGHKSAARAEITMAALDEAVTQNQRKLARWVTWQIEHPAVRGRL